MLLLYSTLQIMGMIVQVWLFFLILFVGIDYVHAGSHLIVENSQDYETLDQFFRMGFLDEEYGFVLDGIKPISIRDVYPLDHFPISTDLEISAKEFRNTILVQKVFSVWNKICANQKNFALKIIPLKSIESVSMGFEVQFINLKKLKEVIENNIILFRYVLGPTIEVEGLLNLIAYSDARRLIEILNHDPVLMGIVLGYGAHNSVMEGHIEKIMTLSFSRDCIPFSPKSSLLQNYRQHVLDFLTPESFGTYYLEFIGDGDDSLFRNEDFFAQTTLDFSKVEKELAVISSMEEPLPSCLAEKPAFVFGAYKKGPSNRLFFKDLQKTQKKIKVLLHKSNFLEEVLEKIGGEKSVIQSESYGKSRVSLLRFYDMGIEEWVRILQNVADRFDEKDRKLAFFESIVEPGPNSKTPPKMIGATKAILVGLKKAVSNLAVAERQLTLLSNDKTLNTIVPKHLYFKINSLGTGEKLQGNHRVRVNYLAQDLNGNVLFAHHDAWIDPSQTIPGFAHGVQGMNIGEKRVLYIHPALGYGALTTLPPCSALTIHVELLGIAEASSEVLPSLKPMDLDWLKNPAFFKMIEDSISQLPCFTGSFYRDQIDHLSDSKKTELLARCREILVALK